MNGVFHQRKVIVRETTSSLARKLARRPFIFKMSKRFVDAGSVDNFIAEQENKATLKKARRDVKKIFASLFRNKLEIRKVEDIPTKQLNDYTCVSFSLHRLISVVIIV